MSPLGPRVTAAAKRAVSFCIVNCGEALNRSEPTKMAKDLIARAWRLAVTVGPLVAIALTLAAGYKWR